MVSTEEQEEDSMHGERKEKVTGKDNRMKREELF